METIKLKINKDYCTFKVVINKYNFTVSLLHGDIEFPQGGVICSGFYNYNNTEVILDGLIKEFKFFSSDIKIAVDKIAQKEKFISRKR